MRNYKSLKRIIIILSVIIAVVFGLFFFTITGIKNKNENITKLQNELLDHASESKYLASIQNIVSKANISIEQINSSILSSDSNVVIIETIEQIATKNGLEITIDSIAVEDLVATKDSDMTTLKIRVKTNGKWIQTYNFISELESLPYQINVEKSSLITGAEAGDLKDRLWQNVFEIRLLKYK